MCRWIGAERVKAALAAVALTGLSAAQAPPPSTQNEQGQCVNRSVHDRFRETVPAEELARDIVDSCVPPHRAAREEDPRRRTRFDELYAAERDAALRVSALRIDRFRRDAAAAASVPRGQQTLTVPVTQIILRMARINWRERTWISETRLDPPVGRRAVPGNEWKRLAVKEVAIESRGGRYATYYTDGAGRVVGLFINSSPRSDCRPFHSGETLAVEVALLAVPAATAFEVERVRASVRAGWTSGLYRVPARVGPYVFLASKIGGSPPGRIGCHDHLSLALANG
jgi:hypothetical protein